MCTKQSIQGNIGNAKSNKKRCLQKQTPGNLLQKPLQKQVIARKQQYFYNVKINTSQKNAKIPLW